MPTELAQLLIVNGFPNLGEGSKLVCTLISGAFDIGDFLMLPNGVDVPISGLRLLPQDIAPCGYEINILSKYDNVYNWSKLYKTIVKVKSKSFGQMV